MKTRLSSVCFVLFGILFLTHILSTYPAESSATYTGSIPQAGFSNWSQANTDGFGEPNNTSILALEIFNNNLYGASNNWASGARIWRLEPTGEWNPVSQPGFDQAYGNLNPAVPDMVVYKGNLYAGTGWGGANSQVWRSSTGGMWNQVVADGFGNDDNIVISPFVVYGGVLYAGTQNIADGLEIWRTDTGNQGDWENVVTGGNGDTKNYIATGFNEFGNSLFAAIENSVEGAEIWQTDNGTTWSLVSAGGFGDPSNIQTGGMTVYNGYLYVGTRNNVTGAQLFRSVNGVNWEPIIADGFGDVNNYKIEMVTVWKGSLFAGTNNNLTGVEIWQSDDGLSWKQINRDGFGDANNLALLWNSSSIIFNHHLYIGLENQVTGGEIWQNLGYLQFLPLALHR